jgi:hypothetical protein
MIYQVSWQRILVLISGVGSHSITTIVASFLAGLGAGSLIGGRIASRCSAARCLTIFALVELSLGLIGHWSSGDSPKNRWLVFSGDAGDPYRMAFEQMLILALPTTLMGMTFPLLTKAIVTHGRRTSHAIGQLYGMNLLGAAFGSLLAPWVLFPAVGISGALVAASVVNATVAAVAIGVASLAARSQEPIEFGLPTRKDSLALEPEGRAVPVAVWYLLTWLSGAISIGLEIAWFRIVDVGAKATSFTFGTVLSVYLAGMAAGTFYAIRRLSGTKRPLSLYLKLQMAIAASTALPITALAYRIQILPFGRSYEAYWGAYEPVSPATASLRQLFELYVALPAILYFLPTFFMGAAFVVLQDGLQSDRRMAGQRLGWAQAMNIFGCVLGSMLVGLTFFDRFGTATTLKILISGYAAMFAVCSLLRLCTGRGWAYLAISLGMIALLPDNETLWRRLHGQSAASRFHFAEDDTGISAMIPEGGRWRVAANGKGQSHIPFGGVHSKLGALPATFAERPMRVALIGLGSGDTAWAAACRSETAEIDVFEICESQWDLLSRINAELQDPRAKALLEDQRVRRIGEDGRVGIRRSPIPYDLIEADAIRPNGAFAGNLYSAEFFRECLDRLAPGGIMCTWSPTPRTLETFASVFPVVLIIDGGQILIGMRNADGIDIEAWKARLQSARVKEYLGAAIQGECLAGIENFEIIRDGRGSAERKRINTDLFPKDEFEID